MRYSFYLLKTLYDVGSKRVIGRLLNDIKKIFFKTLPKKISLCFTRPKFQDSKIQKSIKFLQ